MKKFLPVPALFFSGLLLAKGTPLSVYPKSTFQGGVVAVRYALDAGAEPKGYQLKVNGKDVAWDICPGKRRELCAFVGVEMDKPPKKMEASVTQTAKPGFAESISVTVRHRKYPTGKLKVDPSKAVLSDEDKARVEQERATMKTVWAASEPSVMWEGKFLLPGKSGTTSPFGVQRTFNGTVASTHYGLDLRGNEGTWILASNAGKVVFADHMFLSGNFVAIDHGMGLFTTYSHMSAFSVKPGERVTPGQKLGRAGSTGRVTGPHLHWGVRVNGLYVDPAEFLKVANR